MTRQQVESVQIGAVSEGEKPFATKGMVGVVTAAMIYWLVRTYDHGYGPLFNFTQWIGR